MKRSEVNELPSRTSAKSWQLPFSEWPSLNCFCKPIHESSANVLLLIELNYQIKTKDLSNCGESEKDWILSMCSKKGRRYQI